MNTVGLEQYLWGVVPREMPDTWPAEALKSQAIVARTYALTHMQGLGDFDVYPDTRSQVYGGIAAESAPARDAVNGTAGQVVLYKGELAQTFFFSSSGGRTANVQDVWRLEADAVPRLRARSRTTRSRPTTTGARSSSVRCGSASGSARAGRCSTSTPTPPQTAASAR